MDYHLVLPDLPAEHFRREWFCKCHYFPVTLALHAWLSFHLPLINNLVIAKYLPFSRILQLFIKESGALQA